MTALECLRCQSRSDVLVKLLLAVGPLTTREALKSTGWPRDEFAAAVDESIAARLVIRKNAQGHAVLSAVYASR